MKKFICLFLMFFLVGCNKKITYEKLRKIQDEVTDIIVEKEYTNFASGYVDGNYVIIELVDNSKSNQKWFRENIYDSKYIKFKRGGPYYTSVNKIELVKPEIYNLNKFNIYYENDDRTIYLAGSIEEIYYVEENKISLKDYITNTFQTFDDSIKNITNMLDKTAVFRDGGTTLYKKVDYDLTIVVCNTLAGNKNVYIGDYSMEFDNDLMCK